MIIEIVRDHAPQPTIELETADLKELAQHGTLATQRPTSGEARARPSEAARGGVDSHEAKVIIKQPTIAVAKVVVDLGDEPSDAKPAALREREPSNTTARPGTPIHVRRVAPARPRVHVDHATKKTTGSGLWFVVLIYLVSAGALGLSIYYRFIA